MKPLSVYTKLGDTVKKICTALKFTLLKKKSNRGRKLFVSREEAITFGLYKQRQNIATKKALYDDFKPNCSYKTFVLALNASAFYVALILKKLIEFHRRHAHLVKHTDSTDIPVCLNKNAKRHKTMQGEASWGHSGKGLFYGIKLHLTTDLDRHLLSFTFATGRKDDRSQFMKLNKDIYGIFVADAGYVSEKLAREFSKEDRRVLITKPRKNMKKLASALDLLLYDTRMTIELNFRNLKMLHGLVTSMPRSVNGYMAHYLYSIAAYVLK
jgi:hypothetical protein